MKRLAIAFAVLLILMPLFMPDTLGAQDPGENPEERVATNSEWWAWAVPGHSDLLAGSMVAEFAPVMESGAPLIPVQYAGQFLQVGTGTDGGWAFAPDDAGGDSVSATRPYPWLTGPMSTASWLVTTGIATTMALYWGTHNDRSSQDDLDAIQEPGDTLQWLLPVSGLAVAGIAKDKYGVYQSLGTMGLAAVSTRILKELAQKWRPNLSSTASFPSGHTSAAFSGAAFYQVRYGWKWGVPAYLLAAYTGASRVFGQKHHLDDALSGATVGIFSALAVVRPVEPERRAKYMDMSRPRPLRYSWEFGGGYQDENIAAAPSVGGTPFSPEISGESNPTTTARFIFEGTAAERHNWFVLVSPFEVRDIGVVATGGMFNGQVYNPGDSVGSIYLLYDYRAGYRYSIVKNERWDFKIGASAAYQDTEIGIAEPLNAQLDGTEYNFVRDLRWVPMGQVYLGFWATPKIEFYLDAAGSNVNIDTMYDASVMFNYQHSSRWGFNFGYRRYSREINEPDVSNTFTRDGPIFGIAYSFGSAS